MTMVAMIWREHPSRVRAFGIATAFWRQVGAVMLFDSGHGVFNRASSRNMAVRWAQEHGVDRLVVSDADTICDIHSVQEALEQADDSAVHLPYTVCRVFNEQDELAGEFTFTCGGVYVTTPTAWFAVGGQDERFTKWAPEDMAFNLAHETLAGPMRRHDGAIASLGHARDEHRHSDDETDPLVQLYRQYEAAHGNVDRMRALCFPSS